MQLPISQLFVLLAAGSAVFQVVAQQTDSDLLQRDVVDAIGARETTPEYISLGRRALEEFRHESRDQAIRIERSLEHLERRGKSVCYAGCNQFTGANKQACWRKCDAIWK
ncbi:hypothetical protein B0H34DRAFT_706014 [Crassisporium funariophilum]|nr:hypothetical protein B0H34DRAFT_705996 [Crassisporium funariophilum]KAF8160059.1 hypothetical protein B0H34DRAFT_706014 [Crassisporium funariophilum]